LILTTRARHSNISSR